MIPNYNLDCGFLKLPSTISTFCICGQCYWYRKAMYQRKPQAFHEWLSIPVTKHSIEYTPPQMKFEMTDLR